MKHIRTIKPKNNANDVHYAVSCKTSVTLGTNFNSEKKNEK